MGEFWDHPLVKWLVSVAELPKIKKLSQIDTPNELTYSQMCNAALLNAILVYCDPGNVCQSVTVDASDFASRIKNMHILLTNMQAFYKEVLCQLIVMPLPDLLFIARNPFPEGSGEEMKKVLLLLLGCAVQSPEKKQEFIERIQQLESSLQHALMQEISKIIGSTEYVLSVQALELEGNQESTATVLHQLQRVVKERDIYASAMVEMGAEQESDSGSGASIGCCNGDVCARKLPECQQHDMRPGSPSSSDRNHLMLELASIQAKLRRARSERDEATELVEELRSDLTLKERECGQIQKDKVELLREASRAKQYRDELDEWKIKGSQADRLEKENDKLREKLSDLEFYRSRVEELKRDNHLLQETGQVKESQIQKWKELAQKRESEDRKLIETEKIIIELQEKLKVEMNRVEELVKESAARDHDYQTSVEKCNSLEKELLNVKTPETPRLHTGTLEDQINGSAQSQLIALQLQNEKLKLELGEKSDGKQAEECSANENVLKEKDEEIEKLKEDKTDLEDHLRDMEKRLTELDEDREDAFSEVQADRDRFRDECHAITQRFQQFQSDARNLATEEEQRKVEHLRQEADSYKSRNESLSKDNKRFAQELSRVKSELKQAENKLLEFEEVSLNSEQKLHAFEREIRCLQREKSTLREKLETSDLEVETCRSRLVELEQDHRRIQDQANRLEEARARLSELETEKMQACSQMDMESKRAHRLSQDLIQEKTTSSQLVARISSLCSMVGVSPPTSDPESCLKSDRALLDKWTSLQTEADRLKIRVSTAESASEELKSSLQTSTNELDTLKKQIRDNTNCQSSNDLGKVKDLETENGNIKEQVGILQEKIRKLQAQLLLKENNYNQLKKEATDLKSQLNENARMEVDLRNAELREDLLKQDNEEMQKQCIDMIKDQQAVSKDYQQLQRLHSDFLCDHEQLQNLHEQLNRDYETVKREINELRRRCRDQRNTDGEMNCLKTQAEKDRKVAEEMKLLMCEEREKREKDLRNYALLQNEHSDIKKRLEETKCKYEVLRQDFADQQNTIGRIKTDYHGSQTSCSRYESTVQELQKDLGLKDLDCGRLQARCDMLEELNAARGDENQQVLRQLDMLISQNQDLLNQLLMDQEKYHGKETDMQEKLNALKRQKEKLEEKIMDQYKTIPTKRKDKDTFVRRAAKTLMFRAPSRRRRSSKEGRGSSEDTSSAMSADEATLHAEGRVSPHHGQCLIPTESGRAFCTSTTSSSTSSGSACTPPFSSGEDKSNCSKPHPSSNFNRISWTGSERAVDAPVHSRVPCMGTSMRNASTPGSPARPPLPPRMGIGREDRPPPPPYPAKPMKLPNNGARILPNHRPPPPPYPGVTASPSSLRSQKNHPNTCSSPANLGRFRPDLAAETKESLTPACNDDSSTLFAPAKTSTPKMEHSNRFNPPRDPDLEFGESKIDDDLVIAAPIPGGTVFMRKYNSALNSRAISLYENVDELNGKVEEEDRDSIADELEGSQLFPTSNNNNDSDATEKKATIWYEYGCL